MKTKILLISLIFLFESNVFSQKMLTHQDAVELKKRTLIIGLEEPNQKSIKKMKPEDLEVYKDQIEGNNNSLRNAVEKYWKFSSNVKYMPLSEATDLIKKNIKEYALLKYNKYKDYEVSHGWSRNSAGQVTYSRSVRAKLSNQLMALNIDMPSTICGANLPSLVVSEADAICGIMQIQDGLNKLYENEKLTSMDLLKQCHADILKKKTLLLDADEVDKKLDEKAIAKLYPYKFKVVSADEFEKAIISLDPECVIVQIITKENTSVQFLQETSTGCIVGYLIPSVSNITSLGERIKDKQIKEYAKLANCK